MYMLGWSEPPRRAMALGGNPALPDGRDMPDVHATLFDYGRAPVYLRLNLGCETPEVYRFQGSKGILEVTERGIGYSSQTGRTQRRATTRTASRGDARGLLQEVARGARPAPGKEPLLEGFSYRGASWDELKPHLSRSSTR